MKKRKKIVITGASGFLGCHLVERLKGDERYRVFALSSTPEQLKEQIRGANIEYCYKNVIEEEYAAEILNGAIIINCAYPRNSTGTVIADGLKYIQRVFESAVEIGATAIINISSQSVYSQQRTEIATEKTPVCLENPYAVGKYAVELMLETICKGSETAYTNLRMASLIGPGFDQRIVNRMVKQAIAGEELHVVRNNQKFGFLDIEDAIESLMALLDTDVVQWKLAYNVGNGKEYSVVYIAECIKYVFEGNGLPFPNINAVNGDGFGSTGIDYNLLHKDTGFEPTVSLDASIQRILEYFKCRTEKFKIRK